ncbi:dihydrofolate reductase [Candidatus Woesearchaeota archaeon]|nr:dihydrofolate reductase [Candidatus Woesearchaeota archaeon]
MELILIAAVAENGVIGKAGGIPWRIPEDMKHFKELTLHHPVIMGRKTYESIPAKFRPLPQRRNMILTHQSNYQQQGAEVYHSLDDALQAVDVHSEKEIYVIGGQQIYELAMPFATRLEITEVHQNVEGDAYFPKIDKSEWKELLRKDYEKYSFVTLVKR